MNQPVPPSSSSMELRQRRAADEILIAAIYGLSEREDEAATASAIPRLARKPRRSSATAAAG